MGLMSTTATADQQPAAHGLLWLLAGVIFGLVLGFAAGLTRPHVKG